MREPQAWNCSSESCVVSSANSPVGIRYAAGEPIWTKPAYSPRRRGGAASAVSSTAPPCSPPTPKPWISRTSTRMAAAHRPMDW